MTPSRPLTTTLAATFVVLATGCAEPPEPREPAFAYQPAPSPPPAPAPAAAAQGTWLAQDGRTYFVPEGPAPQVEDEALPSEEEAPPPRRKRKHREPRKRKHIDPGMTVAGGIFAGVGLLAFFGGLVGYFATVRCSSGGYFGLDIRCTDHKEVLFISLAGVITGVAVGTPLLVVGLKDHPPSSEPAPSVSFSVTPTSGFATLSF